MMHFALLLLLASSSHADGGGRNVDWANYGNDKGGMRYSPLKQIDRSTVSGLQVAWVYHTQETLAKGSTIECTPVVVDGVMYITTANLNVLALDAATGKPLWKYETHAHGGVNRGIGYWSDGRPGGERRAVVALNDGRVISLDARTGVPDPAFGKGGSVQLRDGIDRDLGNTVYGSTSAPTIFENLVIVPIIVPESMPGAPGDVRAFDIRTGKEAWRFHTVPLPGEAGHDDWAKGGWEGRTGGNAWSGYTLDAKRGILFAGLGCVASDFYGADRPGQNLYGNSTIALNARTGKLLWHFQSVHHDLWDHDLPCPPIVCTLKVGGKTIDAVAQPTKTGFIFVFDRRTGEPVFGVKEVPAVASSMPGEQAWPTQPVPLKPPPLELQGVTDADITNLSPEAHDFAVKEAAKLRYGSPYVPPSLEGTIVAPGFHGGATWSGASFDPTSHWLYINTNNTPYVSKLQPDGPNSYQFMGYQYFSDGQGYPGVKPPWGHLTAVNLDTGEFAWRIPLGEFPELTARGIPQTGTQNFGGTIVTAGGLVFIGGTMDEKFHAFDKTTGKLLWETKLDAGGYATPSTYMANGKQYVVIAAGGGGKLGTKSGDEFIAFALP